MLTLALTPEEFRHINRLCQRVLINARTAALDLKCYLVTRLSASLPETAARIEMFDDRQMDALRQAILQAGQADANSPLGSVPSGTPQPGRPAAPASG